MDRDAHRRDAVNRFVFIEIFLFLVAITVVVASNTGTAEPPFHPELAWEEDLLVEILDVSVTGKDRQVMHILASKRSETQVIHIPLLEINVWQDEKRQTYRFADGPSQMGRFNITYLLEGDHFLYGLFSHGDIVRFDIPLDRAVSCHHLTVLLESDARLLHEHFRCPRESSGIEMFFSH